MMGRGGQGFPPRGMGRMGQGGGMGGGRNRGFQGRGMGRRGSAMPPPPDVRPFPQRSPEDVIRSVPPMQRRGMGRRERDLPEPKEDEDVVRPPMQGRGMMGRGGQGFPPRGMGRPGPRFPEPKPEND
jgi:hypothetical protein